MVQGTRSDHPVKAAADGTMLSIIIFALTLVVGARVGGAVFAAMGWFIGVQIVFAALVVLAMLALTVMAGRIPVGIAIRGVTPPLLVAAGTSSSLSEDFVTFQGPGPS